MEIPNGWRKTSLGALVKHTKGFAFKSKNYKSSGVRIIRISDTSGLNIKVGNEIYCSEKEAKSLDSYQLEVDDIIVNTVGSRPHLRESMVGRVIRITKDEAGSLLNQNMVRLKPNSAIDSDFLFYSISNEHFLDFVSRIVRGNANQVSITLKDLFTFPASLPPLPEQKRIAKIIGTWNQAIAVTEALIDQSEAQKKALMQQLLTGKRRLPGFEGEWQEAKLGDVANCLDNKRVPLNGTQRAELQGVVPYYGANGVVDYVSQHIFNQDLVLLAEDGGYFDEFSTRPIAQLVTGKSWVNNHAHILEAKQQTTEKWLFYSLVHKNIMAFINAGTRAKLNKSDMLSIPILMPNKDEQIEITQLLDSAYSEVDKLKSKLEILRTEKAALMQQLLTGKRRVKLTEAAA